MIVFMMSLFLGQMNQTVWANAANEMIKQNKVAKAKEKAEKDSEKSSAKGEGRIATVYYKLEKPVLTNYQSRSKSLGYARISVQFLLVNAEATPSVELHEPMVLDTLIDLVYRERSRTIRSMPGREAMRANMKKTLQKKFKEETGKEIIKEVFFTQFLVH